MTHHTTIDTPEAANLNLISSEHVTGTDVFNAEGEQLGTVESMLIDRQSGQVRFAVMSFGGFLGIGERYHQLPWKGLSYDTDRQGYIVNASLEDLKSAPSYSQNELDGFDYDRQSASIDAYYANLDGFYSPHQQGLRNSGQRAGDDVVAAKPGDYRR